MSNKQAKECSSGVVNGAMHASGAATLPKGRAVIIATVPLGPARGEGERLQRLAPHQ